MASASAAAILSDTAARTAQRGPAPAPADAAAVGLTGAFAAASLAAGLAAMRVAGASLLPELLFGAAFAAGLGASGMAKPSKAPTTRAPHSTLHASKARTHASFYARMRKWDEQTQMRICAQPSA